MNIKDRREIIENILPVDTPENKIEILKELISVKSRVKNEITEDFVFCKFGDKDKEFTTEMTTNAYYSKQMLGQLTVKGSYYWDWDKSNGRWVWIKRGEDYIKAMNKLSDLIFDTMMVRCFMIAILNRNVKNNYILRLVSGYNEEEPESLEDKEDKKPKSLLQKLFGKKRKDILSDEKE